jgi:hypothetical protein
MQISPVACAIAARMAAPFPEFFSWRTTTSDGSSSRSRFSTSRVPSFEPSSTTMISLSTGEAFTRRRSSSMVPFSL